MLMRQAAYDNLCPMVQAGCHLLVLASARTVSVSG
jgi:hypothetical protein